MANDYSLLLPKKLPYSLIATVRYPALQLEMGSVWASCCTDTEKNTDITCYTLQHYKAVIKSPFSNKLCVSPRGWVSTKAFREFASVHRTKGETFRPPFYSLFIECIFSSAGYFPAHRLKMEPALHLFRGIYTEPLIRLFEDHGTVQLLAVILVVIYQEPVMHIL